jgi:hypothetical protein
VHFVLNSCSAAPKSNGTEVAVGLERRGHDFFHVDTIRLRRLYIISLIELGRRRVRITGMTEQPDRAWVTQQA